MQRNKAQFFYSLRGHKKRMRLYGEDGQGRERKQTITAKILNGCIGDVRKYSKGCHQRQRINSYSLLFIFLLHFIRFCSLTVISINITKRK